jgi:hypothetical protein
MKDLSPKFTFVLPFAACFLVILTKKMVIHEYVYIIVAALAALYYFPVKLLLVKDIDSAKTKIKVVNVIGYFFYFSILLISIILLITPASVFTSAYQLSAVVYLLFLLFFNSIAKVDKYELLTTIGFYLLAGLVYFI